MSSAEPGARRHFPQLDPATLQHPFDRRALASLQKIPGLDIAVRKFLELFPERVAYIMNVAQSVRVSPTQCPRIYTLLHEACAILDMPEPELYIAQTPLVNAMTSGHDHPYILIHSGLVDLLTDAEIQAVIAHELGHIKCGHVLYKTMARGIGLLLQLIGDLTLGIGRLVGLSLEGTLLEWDRMAEFSADRASLLVVQDSQVVLSLMMKLAGGTLFQRDQMNAEEFLQQADLYRAVDANVLDRLYKAMLVAPTTHPMLIVRASEIVKWGNSGEYQGVLAGRYKRTGGQTVPPSNGSASNGVNQAAAAGDRLIICPHCKRAQNNQHFCSHCGGEIA
ncbi:MAG TPA: M48 family metallopeptidase [Ktedonobacteraceae bacterium]|nr:M48 family metallopeptidase [Ktedonobacteraceae bacterium]